MTDAEFVLIKRRLRVLMGIDLDAYKGPQMQRRLDGYLSRTHAASWTEYLHQLERDPQALAQLRDFIAINVTNFFRDRHKWDELNRAILPQLALRGRPLRAWSAACSQGSEAYSLAMLFHNHPGIIRYQVTGTDVDGAVLQQARAGGPYHADDVREVPPEYLNTFFKHDERGYWVVPLLRERVRFLQTDLLKSTANAEYELVVCRNVLIYFTEAAKEQVIRSLVQALVPGGFLFIGATESIPHQQTAGLERLGTSFFRKVA